MSKRQPDLDTRSIAPARELGLRPRVLRGLRNEFPHKIIQCLKPLNTTRRQGLRLLFLHAAMCMLWNCARLDIMHKALTVETSRTFASRICIWFPICIRFPSGVPLRLVPFAKDLTQSGPVLWYTPFMYPRGQRGEVGGKPPAEATTSFFRCHSYKGSHVYAHLEFRNDRDAQCPQQWRGH